MPISNNNRISNAPQVNSISDSDLFVISQNPGEKNSVSISMLRGYLLDDFIPTPLRTGQAGQILTSNGSGGTFWSTLSGGNITTDYENLFHLPSINTIPLLGNVTSHDIGVADEVHQHTISDITDFPSLASVAYTGSYNSLGDKPTIPPTVSVNQIQQSGTKIATITIGSSNTDIYAPTSAGVSYLYRMIGADQISLGGFRSMKLQKSSDGGTTWADESYVPFLPSLISVFTNDANYVRKTDLASVAGSGDYNDLINTPTIPNPVSVTQIQSTGTEIARITIGTNTTRIYSPTEGGGSLYRIDGGDFSVNGYRSIGFYESPDNGSTWSLNSSVSIPTVVSGYTNDAGYLTDQDISVSPQISTGVHIADVTINGVVKQIFAPAGSASGLIYRLVGNSSWTDHQGNTWYEDVTLEESADSGATWTVTNTINTSPRELGLYENTAGFVLGSSLASVATSGDYNDLVNTPIIPDAVMFNALYNTGTKIGTITIGANATDIYIPNGEGSSVSYLYRLSGSNPDTGNTGYRTIGIEQSTDGGITYNAINSISIPSNVSAFTNDANYITSSILASVATSGDYGDLINTPTIPDPVNVTQIQSTGTKIAEISVGSTTTDIYAPSGGGGGSVSLSTVTMSSDCSDSDSISGPSTVVTGTDAVFFAKEMSQDKLLKFNSWYINGGGSPIYDNPLTINVSNNISLYANYIDSELYSIVLLTDWNQHWRGVFDPNYPGTTLFLTDTNNPILHYELEDSNNVPYNITLAELIETNYNDFVGATGEGNIYDLITNGATIGGSVYKLTVHAGATPDELLNHIESVGYPGSMCRLRDESTPDVVYATLEDYNISDNTVTLSFFKYVYSVDHSGDSMFKLFYSNMSPNGYGSYYVHLGRIRIPIGEFPHFWATANSSRLDPSDPDKLCFSADDLRDLITMLDNSEEHRNLYGPVIVPL